MFRGIKFANPEIVLEQKDFYRRDKDVRDIEIADALSSVEPAPFDPAFDLRRARSVIRELTLGTSARSARYHSGWRCSACSDLMIPSVQVSRILFGCAIRFPCD